MKLVLHSTTEAQCDLAWILSLNAEKEGTNRLQRRGEGTVRKGQVKQESKDQKDAQWPLHPFGS